MHLIGVVLVPLWLLLALILLILNGQILLFAIITVPSSVLTVMAVVLIRDQRKASLMDEVRYRVADDLSRPMTEVVAEAEATVTYQLGGGLRKWD